MTDTNTAESRTLKCTNKDASRDSGKCDAVLITTRTKTPPCPRCGRSLAKSEAEG